MPKDRTIQKVLVIGSGPIVIGQAAEFDYAGTQACRALKAEGIDVVLVNSNPATIMTDPEMADRVYIEPLTADFLKQIIRRERPDGILATLGGQTGLNLAVELAEQGVLEREGIRLLGADVQAIKRAEDRHLFRECMMEIGQSVPGSDTVHSVKEAVQFASRAGYPVVVRPAFTLGGTGGGIAHSEAELKQVMEGALKRSPIRQALVEESVAGYKEIEFEVIRDGGNDAIIVCDMENVDPVGVHTGDSIVVAPSQTLSAGELEKLKAAAIEIVCHLGMIGGCNVQFAYDAANRQHYVIEVNPRVSRSSALASKATGYPIAKVTALIALGYTLAELPNPVTNKGTAKIEPVCRYVVTKIPRWPFDKFPAAERRLGTQMKSTGEVMALGATFTESLHKAVRSLELAVSDLYDPACAALDRPSIEESISVPSDKRLFAIAEAVRRKYDIETLHRLSGIDPFFLQGIAELVKYEKVLAQSPLDRDVLLQAKCLGFSDETIARLQNAAVEDVRALRLDRNIRPTYRAVDACAVDGSAIAPYFYSTYTVEPAEKEDGIERKKPAIIVLGSGPIRIGQGIEFDYATVHAVQAIREAGYEAVIVNNNPETVSTDFDLPDRLYFEPLSLEDVLNMVERENPLGVIVQFGGQTSLNLARKLDQLGIPILGTTMDSMNRAEDREQFEQLLGALNIRRPEGAAVTSLAEAIQYANHFGYPLLVRPSYVLGGRAMHIVHNESELKAYVKEAFAASPDDPVLIDRYLEGREFEVDALCDGRDVLVPGIIEHVERAGVHSGDSIAIYPSQSLSRQEKAEVVELTTRIARALDVRGLLNIQFVYYEGEFYVLEVNPRASRTVPFLGKVTGLPIARLATRLMLGETLAEHSIAIGLFPEGDKVAVKVPVFSFSKLPDVEVVLGPEMKSTGEVMGCDNSYPRALYKGFRAADLFIPPEGTALLTVADKDKPDVLPLAKRMYRLGYRLFATNGTATSLSAAGLPVTSIAKLSEGSDAIVQYIRNGEIDLVVNTWTLGGEPQRDGFRIRRAAVENGVACLTSLDTLSALLDVMEARAFSVNPLEGVKARV